MKKYPIPDKPLKNKEAIRTYIETLVFNTMEWLNIAGYTFVVYLPGEEGFSERKNAGISISVQYPYKKFDIYLQEPSVNNILNKPTDALFSNIECSIFHEMFHLILWKFAELSKERYVTPIELENEEEFITDHLAHIIYPLVKASRKKK